MVALPANAFQTFSEQPLVTTVPQSSVEFERGGVCLFYEGVIEPAFTSSATACVHICK